MSNPSTVPFYKTPNISIRSSIASPAALPTLQQAVECIGHRSLIDGASQLAPLTPAPGYPQLQYFHPFVMPPLGSGNEALSYMKNLGFTVNYGLSGDLLFPAPSAIVTNLNGTVTLSYAAQPQNYNLLLQSGFTASITQTTSGAEGIFLSASVNSYAITLGSVSGTFVTTGADTIELAYINNSLGLPDPNRTEEICMQVFHMYQVINNIATVNSGSQYNFVKPNIIISVLTDRETSGSFSPNPANLSLGVPTDTAIQTSGDVYVGWTAVPTQSAYVPLTQLGDSALNQLTSLATGVIKSVLAPYTIAGCAFVVNLGPVTGVFDTTHAINLKLDATQTVFTLMETIPFTAIVNPYNVATNTDISTNQAEYFDYIAAVNQPTEVEKGHYGVVGTFANTTIAATSMASLLPTDIDNNWYEAVYFPYVPNVGEYPQSSAVVAATIAAFFSCNSAPYNPQSVLIVPSLLSSANTQNRVVYGLTGPTSSEIALDLGWSPLCVNAAGQVITSRLVTGQTTLPGTSVTDVEFFPLTTWQIVTLFKQQLYVALIVAKVKQLRQSPQVLTKIKGVVIALMIQFETNGMFENSAILAKLVTVTRAINAPDTIIIDVPITVIPELASANVQVGLISSVFNLGA